MLEPRPTPKLEDHPLSAVRDCFSNIFAATIHIGGRSKIRKPEYAPCRGHRDPQPRKLILKEVILCTAIHSDLVIVDTNSSTAATIQK